MSKYLVTGGAGFIGSNLVDSLVASGDDVVVLDDLSSGRIENLAASRDHITFLEGSITDLDAVARAMEGVDYVLHHAALASVPQSIEDPWRNHRINVDGTFGLLLAARDARVKRFVLASSSAIYGNREESPKLESFETDPLSPYATSKLIGEDYCRQFTAAGWVPCVCLRYFNIFGPRQDPHSDYAAVIPIFIRRLLDGNPAVIYGDGGQTRDFVFIENVVRANRLAVENDSAVGGVFNIGCGEAITLNDLYRRIAGVLGSELEPVHAPAREGEVRHSLAAIGRAREGLGFEVAVDYRDGLEKTCRWFREAASSTEGAPGR